MPLEPSEPTIAADGVGIHFLRTGRDITVHWGEIEAICALREEPPEGTAYLRFFVDVFAGVDFQFTNADAGYEQVMAEMAKHLMGFCASVPSPWAHGKRKMTFPWSGAAT